MGRVVAATTVAVLGFSALLLVASGLGQAAGDALSPTLVLPADTATNATSSRGATVSYIAVATDDTAPTSLACSPSSGSFFVVGATTVTCAATDASSHSTTSTFVITVNSAADKLTQL